MLTLCPECNLQVSDKAFVCPHCGYPLKQEKIDKIYKTKRKRLPNGFGQITKINNKNLRNPYRAMVTIGKNEYGKPICKLLKPVAYFRSYNEAYQALLEYNRNPYDISTITMSELFSEWIIDYKRTVGNESVNQSKRAWEYCYSIYNMKVSDVRVRNLKFCVYDSVISKNGTETSPTARMKNIIKTTLNLLFDYALENEIVLINRARLFTIDNETIESLKYNNESHKNYTKKELDILWNNLENFPDAAIILIQSYSGWRPQEMQNITINDINFEENYIVGGSKTKSGKNRKVPIHNKIKPLIKQYYEKAIKNKRENLFTCDLKFKKSIPLSNYNYKYLIKELTNSLGLENDHKPHDGRVTFVTLAKEYNVDEYAIKKIIGHAINDITETIYTKRDPNWLNTEMQKIR